MDEGIERQIRLADKERILSHGIERTYLTYIPEQCKSSQDNALVFVLHGALANGENAMRMADMEALADRDGVILIYPDGAGKRGDRVFTWNSGHCCGYALETQSKDSAFLTDLIQKFISEYSVNPKKVFLTGISNGAFMAHRFACEHSRNVAAIATVSGAKNFDEMDATDNVSVMVFHGTDDAHTPYDGGEGEETLFKRHDQPIRSTIDYWVKYNGCNPKPSKSQHLSVMTETYSGGNNNTEVIFHHLESHGHAWPGGKEGRRYGNIDLPSQDISATELIWEFFKTHPKSAE